MKMYAVVNHMMNKHNAQFLSYDEDNDRTMFLLDNGYSELGVERYEGNYYAVLWNALTIPAGNLTDLKKTVDQILS